MSEGTAAAGVSAGAARLLYNEGDNEGGTIEMVADAEAKRAAHHLLDRMDPRQLDAVVRLLELLTGSDEEALSEEDREAVMLSRDYFARDPLAGFTLEQVAAECGISLDEIRGSSGREADPLRAGRSQSDSGY